MRKKIIACVMALVIAAAFMPTSAFAASKAKMKVYDQVYKTGNTAYCAGVKGIYKVKLKNGAVTSCKLIYKVVDCYGEGISDISAIHKKGKYIYFLEEQYGYNPSLIRVTTSGKKKKTLAKEVTKYAIKGKKIYYIHVVLESDKTEKRVMKLNGKSNKKTSKKVKMKTVKSNKSGYSMKYVYKEYSEEKQDKTGKYGYNYDYLVTPRGTYFLGGTES